MPRTSLAIPAIVLVAAVTAACGSVDNRSHVPGIQQTLESPPEWVDEGELGDRLWALERTFYERRGHMPAWIDGVETTPQMKALLGQLRHAERHGLDPARYGVDEFERVRAAAQTRLRGTRFDPAVVPELDTRLTYAYLQYAADLRGWRTRPEDVSGNWAAEEPDADLAAHLASALESPEEIGSTLEQLAPAHPQYRGLQTALAREREQGGGSDRIERIVMNMERWRWMPRDLGDRYVLVNVPGYMLQVMEGGDPALAMRVIVGQPDTPTPLFSDTMTHVVFSPYWNIPESILQEETLPRAARDPDFLARNNIEVVGTSGRAAVDLWSIDWSDESAVEGLRFRQRPGPQNALGLVKFMFPNRFAVYLHDTPGDRLFARETRAFSHGCIRIENPVALAEYVLDDQSDWTGPRIEQAMHARQERSVTLEQPLPVHIGYWTAWVEPDGSVTFLDDPYDIDTAHARARAAAD